MMYRLINKARRLTFFLNNYILMAVWRNHEKNKLFLHSKKKSGVQCTRGLLLELQVGPSGKVASLILCK